MTFIPEKDYKLTPGKEQLIVERNTVLSSEPIVGNVISKLRETFITSSSGIISASFSKIVMGTGTTPGSTAKLVTKRRAEYVAGFSAEVGVGVIIPTPPVLDQYAQWGYYDSNNGVGAGVDVTGSYFFRRMNSETEKVYQSDWNIDTMDGSGSSGLTLDLSEGVICEIDFTWYGLGDVSLNYRLFDSINNERRKVEVNKFNVTGTLSFNVPNQPITCEISNGSSSEDFRMFLGGRQVTLFGKGQSYERPISMFITGSQINLTTPTTIASFKKKNLFGFNNGLENSIQTIIQNVDFISDQPVLYEIIYGISGSGFSYGDYYDIPGIAVSESVMQYQPGGSAWPGESLVIACGFVPGNSTPNSKILSLVQDRITSQLILGDNDVIQVRASKLSANNAIVSLCIEWAERW